MIQQIRAVLEIDHARGVIYVHDADTGTTRLRICGLPSPIPLNAELIDVTNKVGSSYGARATPRQEEQVSKTCPDCDDLLQHHYDDGCARCPCTTSNTEAEYRMMLKDEQAAEQTRASECNGANDGTCPKHPEVSLDSTENS